MYKARLSFYIISFSFIIFSCKKDQKIEPVKEQVKEEIIFSDNGSVAFNFNALADNLPLIANTKWYVNANGDNYTVSRFNYYVSNVKLKRDNGSVFSEPESYHIIKHIEGARSFNILNVPPGDYDQIEFTIGVDSARNVSGAQTGDLSPDSLMFWTWSTGYIFFKLEGEYQTLNSMPGATYAMHVGGFDGKDNCIRKCTFNLTNKLSIKKEKTSKVFYDVNINEIFNNPAVIDLDSYFVITSGQHGKMVASNYVDMFSINHIEN